MGASERSSDAGVRTIRLAYEGYRREFRAITGHARQRFRERDWRAGQRDATARLDLYRRAVEEVVRALHGVLAHRVRDVATWKEMKALFSEEVATFGDREVAETFFNSVTRRIFTTVGVDPDIEFVDLDMRRLRYGPGAPVYRAHPLASTLTDLVRGVLTDQGLGVPFADLERDARLVAAEIDAIWRASGLEPIDTVELIEAPFFRVSGAYLVGRVRCGPAIRPLVMVLVHSDAGLEVDAVLLKESEVSIIFSFTRSHFLVEVDRPHDVVRFLSSIMPRKPVAELYISIGFSKHGKSELYRDLLGHLRRSMDRFDYAPGDTGMVMIVFTLRYYDYVFKVIRDEFAYPKTNTREDVTNSYRLVFRHDRAGRLIEAQEFEHLTFETWRFAPELLDELAGAASRDVTVQGDEVAIHHLYIERRVQPLNLFLRSASPGAADQAVLDYGQAIRDMAQTNIFPGDMLLKNFGVTAQGRVTFYDYDELCLVTDCEFRDMPAASAVDEEMAGEPWFYVGDHDVFPEEFLPFMGLPEPQRRLFVEAHGEILTAEFWRNLQARHRAGEVLDIFPYPASKRLRAGERA